jgi:peptidyl-dipeptidase A
VKVTSDVGEYLATVNQTMLKLGTEAGQAGWIYSTYITQDTEALNARANQAYIEAVARYAKEAARYDGAQVTADERRQLNLLKLALELVTPSDAGEAEELTKIASGLEATYGRGKWCKDPAKPETCADIERSRILAKSRNEQIHEAWRLAHDFSP